MFRLCAKVEIKGDRSWSLDFVTAVEITRDTEKLTAEAKITLPKKMKWDGAAEIPVRRGDSVRISLGYDDNLQLAFVGWVRDVGFKTPVVITCEDDMFKLKQMPAVKKAYRSVTLETLLKDQGITHRLNIMGEQSLGAYRVTLTPWPLCSANCRNRASAHFSAMRTASRCFTAECSLNGTAPRRKCSKPGLTSFQTRASSSKRQKTCVCALRLSASCLIIKKSKVEVGDSDGEHRTLHTYNKTESELKAWASRK